MEENIVEKNNLVEEAKGELKFNSRGLLLEFLYLIKDFFFVSDVMLLGKKTLVLKFYNGQVFEVEVKEKIKETTRLLSWAHYKNLF